jgi:hypothetical protein
MRSRVALTVNSYLPCLHIEWIHQSTSTDHAMEDEDTNITELQHSYFIFVESFRYVCTTPRDRSLLRSEIGMANTVAENL